MLSSCKGFVKKSTLNTAKNKITCNYVVNPEMLQAESAMGGLDRPRSSLCCIERFRRWLVSCDCGVGDARVSGFKVATVAPESATT